MLTAIMSDHVGSSATSRGSLAKMTTFPVTSWGDNAGAWISWAHHKFRLGLSGRLAGIASDMGDEK
jgi:hypothetical protein